MIPRWMESCGYRTVRNPDAKDGLWRFRGKKQIVYARAGIDIRVIFEEIKKQIYN
jgi:hypothetical protein